MAVSMQPNVKRMIPGRTHDNFTTQHDKAHTRSQPPPSLMDGAKYHEVNDE